MIAADVTQPHGTVPAEAHTRRRIRLINPNSALSTITMPELIRHMTFSRKAIWAPTSLTICAAVVPRDWDVEIVDECAMDRPHRPTADVDIVGITAMTTQANRAYAIADEYRRLGVTVFLGGIHPSALPEDALPHADAVAKGDAESTLPHMIADWQAGRLQRVYDWSQYPTAPIATPRKDVLRPGDYLVFNPIQTTRGCPHTCTFCTTPGVFGRKFRQREIRDIVEEIREAKERFRSWCFIFADDNFGGNHEWAMELCAALEPLKVSWASQCDILISRSERLLTAMKRSGCVGLILGLESPKQDTLSEAGKRYVRSDSYEWRIRRIQAAGISLWGAFIFGFDHDDWRDCMAVCRFAQRMNLAMSCFPILTPYPGTGVWQQYRREGRITCEDWDRYNGASVVYEPKRMTPAELRHAQMAAFAEFFTLRSSVRRLGVWPIKSRAWVANIACWRGIVHYYARRGRQVPRFADFLDRGSRAWRHADSAGTRRAGGDSPAPTPLRVAAADQHPGDTAGPLEATIAAAVAETDPYVSASRFVAQMNTAAAITPSRAD